MQMSTRASGLHGTVPFLILVAGVRTGGRGGGGGLLTVAAVLFDGGGWELDGAVAGVVLWKGQVLQVHLRVQDVHLEVWWGKHSTRNKPYEEDPNTHTLETVNPTHPPCLTLLLSDFLTNAGRSIGEAIPVHVVGQQEGSFLQDVQEHGGSVSLLRAVHVLPRLQGLGTQ